MHAWRDLPSSTTCRRDAPYFYIPFIPSPVPNLTCNALLGIQEEIHSDSPYMIENRLCCSHFHTVFFFFLTHSQWVLTITLPYRYYSHPCFTHGETKAQRVKRPAQRHTTSGFGFVWMQVCLTPSPVLLSKSLYIFNSLKFKMCKRELSDCLVFWTFGLLPQRKYYHFLSFLPELF